MAKIWLNKGQKEKVIEHMNQEGHNHKDVNYFNVIEKLEDGYYRVEVGYWITYLNCRPKYEKTVITLKLI